MTAKFTSETQAAIDRAAEDAREARNSLDHLTLDLGATAEDWRAEAWQHRGKLLADMAKSLDIPLELLDTPAANHYSALQLAGEPMTTTNAWFQLTRHINGSEATYRGLANDCLARWDYNGAARWRAMADGLQLARNHMEAIAKGIITVQRPEPPVGSATQPPAAGVIPIP